jgi:RND family efflux transporter MFP subunit
VQRKTVTEKVIAYGSVVAQPGKTHSVSIAFETRVRHVLVAPGQFVRENDPLVEIELSPAAQVQFQQAKNAAEAAQKELKQTQERFNLKLATNQDLSAAEKTARDAEAQLTALQHAGAGGDNRVHSDVAGVIAKVNAQDGQIVPPGNPVVEIVAENDIEVKLGVEAEDLSAAQEGAPVTIIPLNDPTAPKVEGTIRLVTRRIDPATRLVDVYVTLPAGTKLFLDGYVRGEIQRTEKNALAVPRSAVLPNESREFEIFTVANNHAIRHTVKIGAENPNEIQVIANDLHEGDPVVTLGNYELEDGMAVEIKK